MVPESQNNKGVPEVSGANSAQPLPPPPPPPRLPKDVPTAAPTSKGIPAPGSKLTTAPKKSSEEKTQTAPGSKRTWKSKALTGAVAGIVLLGAGTWFGSQLPDPTASDAYKQLSASKVDVQTELERSKTSFRTLDAKYAALEQGIGDRERKIAARENAVAANEKKVSDAEAAVGKREGAVTGAEAAKAKNTVGDGTWTVGRNIEAGTYVAGKDVGSSCYWGIYASGTNGAKIIQNDIPGGGRPSVTLSDGQDFKTTRCGTWSKQ